MFVMFKYLIYNYLFFVSGLVFFIPKRRYIGIANSFKNEDVIIKFRYLVQIVCICLMRLALKKDLWQAGNKYRWHRCYFLFR